MSKYLKQMCCCMISESFAFKHGALNRWRKDFLKDLKEEWEALQDGITRAQRSAKNVAHAKYLLYQVHGHCANEHLHPKTSDAALCIQCKPPEDFEATDFTRLK